MSSAAASIDRDLGWLPGRARWSLAAAALLWLAAVVALAGWLLAQHPDLLGGGATGLARHLEAMAGARSRADAWRAEQQRLALEHAARRGAAERETRARLETHLAAAARALEAGELTAPAQRSALAHYRSALAVDPRSIRASIGIGEIADRLTAAARDALARNRFDLARLHLDQATGLAPERGELSRLSEELETRRRAREAGLASLLNKARESFTLGRLVEPRKDSALALYQAVLEEDPDNADAQQGIRTIVDAYSELASASLADGELDNAAAFAHRALAIDAADPTLRSIAERVDQALARRRAAQARAAQVNDALQRAAAAMGRDDLVSPGGESALDALRDVLALDPDNAEARVGIEELVATLSARADQALQAEDFDRAAEQVAALRAVTGDDATGRALERAVRELEIARDETRRLEAALDVDEERRRARRRELGERLVAASAASARGALVAPAGESALDHLRGVLEIDPVNAEALSRLEALSRSLVERYQAAMDTGDAAQARAALEALAAVHGDGVLVGTLNADLTRRTESLAAQREAAERERTLNERIAAAAASREAGVLVDSAGGGALGYVTGALELDPDSPRALAELRRLIAALVERYRGAAERGDLGEAAAALDAVRRIESAGAVTAALELDLERRSQARVEREQQARRRQAVADRLARAAGARERGDLVSASGDSEHTHLVAALEIEPGNREAGAALAALEARLVRQVEEDLAGNDFEGAAAGLETLGAAVGSSPLTVSLGEALERRRAAFSREVETAQTERLVQRHLERAAAASTRGELVTPAGGSALTHLKIALGLDPANGEARQALEALARALAERYRNAVAAEDLEAAAAALDRLDAVPGAGFAVATLREVLDERRRAARASVERSASATAAARHTEARRHEHDLLVEQGHAALAQGRLTRPIESSALAAFRAALALEPTSEAAAAGLNDIRNRMLDGLLTAVREEAFDDARARMREIGSLAGGEALVGSLRSFLDAQERRTASLRGRLSDADQRIESLEAARRVDPELVRRLEAGRAALAAQRLTSPGEDNAWGHFRAALKLDPANASAIRGLAAVSRALIAQASDAVAGNRLDEARSLARELARIDPEHPAADMILTTAELGRAAARREAAATPPAPPPGERRGAPPRQRDIGRLLVAAARAFEGGRFTHPELDNALVYYQTVLALDHGNPDAVEGIATIARRLVELANDAIKDGRLDDANALANEVASFQPDNPFLSLIREEVRRRGG